jgi:hypothetical protein
VVDTLITDPRTWFFITFDHIYPVA